MPFQSDDAVANSIVPELSSTRDPDRFTVNWSSVTVCPAWTTVAPVPPIVPPAHRNGPVIDSTPSPPIVPLVMLAPDATAGVPAAATTSTLPITTAPSSSFAPSPSVCTGEPVSCTRPSAPAEPYVPVDVAPPEPVPSDRFPSAATDSTLPSFSTGAEIPLVVAVAVEEPTVLRITPDDSLTIRAVLKPDRPDDAVAKRDRKSVV